MKKMIFPFIFSCFAIVSLAQVEVDKPIQMTGGTGERVISSLETPVAGTDAANKDYVDNAVAASGGGALTMISAESGSAMNLGAAIRYCNALVESGESDWHLPTFEELLIVTSTGGITVSSNSSTNNIWFIPQNLHWNGGTPIGTGKIKLSDGTISYINMDTATTAYVRCVR